MKKSKIITTTVSLYLLLSCNLGKNEEKKTLKEDIKINKEFITINSIQIGDNINQYKNFKLSDNQNSFFDIYINIENTTINELEGNLILFVSNSIIEKIEFISRGVFWGKTSVGHIAFEMLLNERKEWISDAMLNYNIDNWDKISTKKYQFEKQGYLHQYELEEVNMLGTQIGWYVSYVITSKDAEIKELQGRKSKLNFNSSKEKEDLNNDVTENNQNESEVDFIEESEEVEEKEYLTISVDNLRVRISPDLDSDKIENLAIGSIVEFLDKSNNQTTVTIKNNEITDYWYKVKTQSGNVGWIHGCCFDK